jgi:two-component system chemotaxis response regulator CheB
MQRIVIIGASAGGVAALTTVTAALPADFSATVLIVMHIGARHSLLPGILQQRCPLPVKHAEDGDPLLPGHVLIAPPDRHLTVEVDDGQPRARLWYGPKENHTRPAIDPLFRSAAIAFDGSVVATILTGYLDDGTAGLQAVKACGGYAIVQDPRDAQVPDMPASAIAYVAVDQVLPLAQIGPALSLLSAQSPEHGGGEAPGEALAQAPESLVVESRYVQMAAGMDDLQRIGTASGYTCPECDGALWKIDGAVPTRFRCHTGHSFSMRILSKLQDDAVETALWSSIRALQENMKMAREMAQEALARQDGEEAEQHRQRVDKIQADIDALHSLFKS